MPSASIYATSGRGLYSGVCGSTGEADASTNGGRATQQTMDVNSENFVVKQISLLEEILLHIEWISIHLRKTRMDCDFGGACLRVDGRRADLKAHRRAPPQHDCDGREKRKCVLL